MGDLRTSASLAAVRSGWDDGRPPTGSKWGELARHPLSGGALNVIGVLAGIFGAIIAEDVQQFWLDVGPYEHASKPYRMWAALVFVAASVMGELSIVSP